MAQPDFLVEKRKVASRLTDGIAHAVSVSVQTRKEARDADSGQNIIFGEEKQKSLNNQAFSSYLVETTGIEPVTSCMSSKHSNQLSYASIANCLYIIASLRLFVNTFFNFFRISAKKPRT